MFVSALPDPTCNSEKSANGGNKQISNIKYQSRLRWWGSHFDSFKYSCSVAQNDPFFR